jgi:hypothetical protein
VPYHEDLADPIRRLIGETPEVTEKRMLGGLAFLHRGNLAIAASNLGGIVVRVDPEETTTLIDAGAVHPVEMRGRRMNGWERVSSQQLRSIRELAYWVDRGLSYARPLTPKKRLAHCIDTHESTGSRSTQTADMEPADLAGSAACGTTRQNAMHEGPAP